MRFLVPGLLIVLSTPVFAQETPVDAPTTTEVTPESTQPVDPVDPAPPAPVAATPTAAPVAPTPAAAPAAPLPKSVTVDTTDVRGAGEQLVLNTPAVDVSTVSSITDSASQAVFDNVSSSLEAGIRQATQAIADFSGRITTLRAEIKVAKTNLATRKLNLRAAKKELKAIKLAEDTSGEGDAMRLIDTADLNVRVAKQTLAVKKLEYTWAKAYRAHAETLLDQEQTRLAEARLRSQNPAPEAIDVLKAVRDSSKAEGKEAKARGKLADALGKLRQAKTALKNIR